MSDVLVRLEKAQDFVIEELTKAGVFKTKSEIIRAGIMKLGEGYGIDGPMVIKQATNPKAIAKFQKISDDIKSGRVKLLSEEEVLKKYPHLRNV